MFKILPTRKSRYQVMKLIGIKGTTCSGFENLKLEKLFRPGEKSHVMYKL